MGLGMAKPTKAYYVERIGRTVTQVLVYAENGMDAVARARAGRGVEIASETRPRGYGRAYRAGNEDLADGAGEGEQE